MIKKTVYLVLLIIMGVGVVALTGCGGNDYGYEFHFYVSDGNGSLALDKDISRIWKCNEQPSHTLECPDNSYLAVLMGGKKGSHELTFIAIPDEGFQVKEWLFNGEVVNGNKTNSYKAKVSSEQNYCGVIVVIFEPMITD